MSEENPITQRDLDMVARLNSERFTVDDLLTISDEVHELPEGRRDWQGRMFLLARRFPGKPYRAMAADYRLTAMSQLVADHSLPLGVMPESADGSHTVSESVFAAAATEPILIRGNEAFFEPESFKKRVLELSDADGKA